MWPIILSIIALGIIAGVSFYAFKLLRKLRHQNTLIKQAKIARTKRLKESMVIIAKAMLELRQFLNDVEKFGEA